MGIWFELFAEDWVEFAEWQVAGTCFVVFAVGSWVFGWGGEWLHRWPRRRQGQRSTWCNLWQRVTMMTKYPLLSVVPCHTSNRATMLMEAYNREGHPRNRGFQPSHLPRNRIFMYLRDVAQSTWPREIYTNLVSETDGLLVPKVLQYYTLAECGNQ